MLDRHLERVLKQLRKATADGKGLEINRIEISFTLKSGVKLPASANSCGDRLQSPVESRFRQIATIEH
jgi:hypothetical protein